MKLNKIFLTTLAGLAFVSCADLDTEPTGDTVTKDQKIEVVNNDPSMVSASVTGITSMFSQYCNGLSGSTYHDDFGYPSVMLFLDSRGTDLVSEDIGYNWFSGGLDFSDRATTSSVDEIIWNTLYNQVYACNQVAAILDPESEDATTQFYLAQALSIRAFDYFNLAQIYQFTYYGSEDKPCVPLILDTNADDAASNGAPRATVKEVYTQILSDINTAVSLLEKSDVTREDLLSTGAKRFVNLAVAYGLRARIELVMHDYAAAATDAQNAIDATDAQPKSIAEASQPTFNNMTESDWMWGIYVDETDRVVTSGIINWPSHMGSLNYGYASVGAWRRVSKKLYNAIGMEDARKGWFLDGNKSSANLTNAQQAYVAEKGLPAYTQVKFAPYGGELYTSTNACDIPLMRIEEMYLILAEAQAMSGNASLGAQTLETFVKTYRDASYECTATSAEAVQNEVCTQRRIELWGEGLTYFDLLRLNKGLDRRGAGFQAQYVYNIPADNQNLIFQIPNSETEANPMLEESDNNPSASTPDPVDDEN